MSEEFRAMVTKNAYEVLDASVEALTAAAKALEAGNIPEYLRQTESAELCCVAAKQDGKMLAKLKRGEHGSVPHTRKSR